MLRLRLYTLLYATLRYSTLLYATLRYSTLLYSTLLYATLLYAALLYATLRYSNLNFLRTTVFVPIQNDNKIYRNQQKVNKLGRLLRHFLFHIGLGFASDRHEQTDTCAPKCLPRLTKLVFELTIISHLSKGLKIFETIPTEVA
jgi:hypothetical protein